MINNFTKKIYRQKTIERIENKIKMLGETKLDFGKFLTIRLILAIIIFILLFTLKYGVIIAPLGTIIFYLLFEYFVLDYPISKRSKKLEKEAIFFFEIFILTLEGGRNLRRAIELTTENVDSEISLEFKKVLEEERLGKSLKESLEDMKKRIPSSTINNVVLNLIEANKGGNIISSINEQIEYLREKQRLDVKASISKLPTKVSIISVLFFVPIMLLIILAPVLLEYLG